VEIKEDNQTNKNLNSHLLERFLNYQSTAAKISQKFKYFYSIKQKN